MATGLRRVTNDDGQNDDPQSMDYPKNTIAKEYYNNIGLYVSSVSNSAYLSLNTHFKWC